MGEEKTRYELLREVKLVGEEFTAMEAVWNSLWSEIKRRKTKRYLLFSMRIAALVAVVFGIVFYGAQTTKKSEGNNLLAVTLPCGSEVELAAKSAVRYNRIGWIFSRQLKLTGDATFEVTKGRKFAVKTSQGVITVLGTKFSVEQGEDSFNVACFEGSVSVATRQQAVILHPGEQVSYAKDAGLSLTKIEEELPEYIEYSESELIVVVGKIEEIYGVTIKNTELCSGLKYTGLLSTRNMTEALDIVFGSCDLTYKINDKEIVLSK